MSLSHHHHAAVLVPLELEYILYYLTQSHPSGAHPTSPALTLEILGHDLLPFPLPGILLPYTYYILLYMYRQESWHHGVSGSCQLGPCEGRGGEEEEEQGIVQI
jgi:hypothetical protein